MKQLRLLALVGLLAAILTACGGTKDRNDADVTFAQQMIPHHEQAVEMAEQALSTSRNAEVRKLATQIRAAQAPEIATMNAWLDDWDAGATDHGEMAGMDPGDSGMGMGMMTKSEMASLDKASGAAFDSAWLRLMIRHHEGAVAMAGIERKDGSNAEARKLAAKIITGQKAEIETMKGMVSP